MRGDDLLNPSKIGHLVNFRHPPRPKASHRTPVLGKPFVRPILARCFQGSREIHPVPLERSTDSIAPQ